MKAEVKTYRPKITKTIFLALISLTFVVMGFFIIDDDPRIGFMSLGFFGFCLLVFIIQLIPGSTELKLTNEGFEMTNLFKKNFIKWCDVESFEIGSLGANQTILIDFVENHIENKVGKYISKKLAGYHGALPSTYGLEAKELLTIMNEWKRKYCD